MTLNSRLLGRIRRLHQVLAAEVDRTSVALLFGLALVSVGLWDAWRPGAFLAPGVVLVWLALPARVPFVMRPSGAERRRR